MYTHVNTQTCTQCKVLLVSYSLADFLATLVIQGTFVQSHRVTKTTYEKYNWTTHACGVMCMLVASCEGRRLHVHACGVMWGQEASCACLWRMHDETPERLSSMKKEITSKLNLKNIYNSEQIATGNINLYDFHRVIA